MKCSELSGGSWTLSWGFVFEAASTRPSRLWRRLAEANDYINDDLVLVHKGLRGRVSLPLASTQPRVKCVHPSAPVRRLEQVSNKALALPCPEKPCGLFQMPPHGKPNITGVGGTL